MDAVEKCSKLVKMEEEIADLEAEQSRYSEMAKDYGTRAKNRLAELRKFLREKEDGQLGISLDGPESEDEAPAGVPDFLAGEAETE